MILSILLVVAGIAAVLLGANWLTEGAVGIAKRFKVSELVIGLTIVAMGTSMPEFSVSLVSALKGTADLAVGNVVGSNIFNTLLIVGLAAALSPITVLPATVKKDIPYAVCASGMLFFFASDGNISTVDAIILFSMFCSFLVFTLNTAKSDTAEETATPPVAVWKAVLLILVGLVLLVGGSNAFVNGAGDIARALGVSDAVVGLTIVAGGTSLPELATSVVSARKGNSGIAIGNVLGSNVFNIFFILGITGLVQPMHVQGITTVDYSMLLGSMLLLWLFSRTKYTLARWEGIVLAFAYMVYLGYLIYNVV